MLYVDYVGLDRASVSLKKGEKITLSVVVCPTNATNKTISWRSSNTSIVSVSGGVITATGKGSAYVYAEAQDGSGEYARCSVTVTEDILVTSVTVSPSSKTLTVDDSVYLSETVCPPEASNKNVNWSSSNSSVASVNADTGLVYAKKAGNAVIYATATDGSNTKGSCSITVKGKVYVSRITVNEPTKVLNKGDTYTLSATVYPSNANDKSVRWSSSDPSVATVNANTGLVTAKSAGNVAITAVSRDGSEVSDYCCLSVKQIPNKPEEDLGKTPVKESTVADPIDVYSGAHILENTLISLFGGQGLSLIAHYDSTKLSSGVFGMGWYHNYEKHVENLGSEIRVYNTPSMYLKYSPNQDNGVYACTAANRNGCILTVDLSQPYPYALNCNLNYTEYYNPEGQLAKIVNHQGFETEITYSDTMITIRDSVSGKKMYLEKDATGKVIRVYDDASRQATFTYNGSLLTSIYDLNGNGITYTYNEDGQVLTGIDAKGICFFTNTYDEYGRVIAQSDGIPGSNATTFLYEGNTRITTDRNGNSSIRVFDNNGLLISHTDENGNVKTYSYDEHYNVIKETDSNGNFVIKSYNDFNKPISITDKNGNTTYISYDAKGNIIKVEYPAIEGVVPEETFVYNARNQIVQYTDKRGTVTLYGYDSSAMPASKKIGNKSAICYFYQDGLLKSQTDPMGNTIQYGHNAIGQIVSMKDAANNVTRYEYDACGNLLKTTDANGKSIVNTYDGNHQKTSVTDANGNKTEYSFNENMMNESIVLPDNNVIRYEFDGEDRVVKSVDQSGNVTTIEYDKVGNIVSKLFADGSKAMYEYDKVGNVVKETNPKGAVTIKTYDANGNVLSLTDNAGNITRYQYNPMGKKIRVVNAALGTTIYQYSKAGDLLSETDALGNRKVYTYDAFGNMLTATDAKGNVTSYTYDDNDNMVSVRDALGNITTYTYNCQNQLVSVKDAKNNIINYSYDALGRRTTIVDAKNNVFTTVYDGNGNVIKTLDAKGNIVSETVYNNLNLPASVVDATGKTTIYTYNAIGKVATISDSLNHTQEYLYNSRGQNTAVYDANNNISSAEYDALGNVTKVTGPLGCTINYTYDEMGRLISETTSSGGTISYGYNALNVKDQVTNARGQHRKYFYDAAGRITGVVGVEDSVSYTYDANGNVLTVTDSNGIIRREYDALNRVTKYTDTFGNSIRYEYDSVGNLTRLVYPDNTAVTYSYDENKNLVSVIDWASRTTTYTYDVNNRVVGVTKPNGSVTTTIYDNKQRVVSTVEKTSCGIVITGFEYVYDSLSRIVEEKCLADNTKISYTYDNLSRVITRKIKNQCDEIISVQNYTYDSAGNITDAPGNCFQYDINNRLIMFNGNCVSYDMDGNMLSNGSMVLEYDSINRLIKAGEQTYTYNAEDGRIRNLCIDADTTYTYNTNCKLSQLLTKNTNGITTKYVYGLGLIGEEKCDEFKTYHFDFRGSTVAISDECSNITDTFKYDTYGNLIEHVGSSFVIFGYNGRDGVVTDKNGLIYMRARYYSPAMHRFINADILHGEISDSTSLNRYSYVNGNPVSFVDPFGLSKDAERGKVNVDSLFEILKKMGDKKDTKVATNMLATTLDQLLSFKYLFTVQSEIEFSFFIDANTTGEFSASISSGKGVIKLPDVLSNQLEILDSLSFDMKTGSVSIGRDGLITIKYTCAVDKYSTVVASVSGVPGKSLSASYEITTKDANDNSVTMSIGMVHWKNQNNVSTPAPVPVPVPEPEDDGILEKAGRIALATGLSLVAVLAIAETVVTLGLGSWNDIPALTAAIVAWSAV